jgi:HSP20 family protein
MIGYLSSPSGSVFDDVRRMQQELDELFGQFNGLDAIRSLPRSGFPPINVGVTPEQVQVYLFAAGIDPGRLDVSIQQNVLSIAGVREAPTSQDGRKHFRQERFSGEFRRVLTLPEDVDPEQVDAKYRDGVLQVTVGRRAAARARKIDIQ